MSIEFNLDETLYLLQLVSVDADRMESLMDHAAAHGSELELPKYDTAHTTKYKLISELRRGALIDSNIEKRASEA